MGNTIVLSAMAGAFGALSSIQSKLLVSDGTFLEGINGNALVAIKAALIMGIFLTNIGGWYCFTLLVSSKLPTSLASGLNLGFNFVITALVGQAMFREELSTRWYLGAGIILIGTLLIGSDNETTTMKAKRPKAR